MYRCVYVCICECVCAVSVYVYVIVFTDVLVISYKSRGRITN